MKKLFTSILLSVMALGMNAQVGNLPWNGMSEKNKIVATLGLGGSFVAGKHSDGFSSSFSYKLGVLYEWNVYDDFYFIPGLEFIDRSHRNVGYDSRISMAYVQFPLCAAYKYDLTSVVHALDFFETFDITAKVGPYFSAGLFGTNIEVADDVYKSVFDTYDRFDAGILLGLGVDIGDFALGLEFSRGFAKFYDKMRLYHMAFGVTMAYKL